MAGPEAGACVKWAPYAALWVFNVWLFVKVKW